MTFLRQSVLDCLGKFKDTEYLTLLNLIGNYAPLSLSIYSVLYKASNYELYNLAMHQVWCMYFTFKRKHYDKSLLVLLTQPTGNTSNIHSILYQRTTFTSVKRTLWKISTVYREHEQMPGTHHNIQEKARWINQKKHVLQHLKY